MNFYLALKAMQMGRKVKRPSFKDIAYLSIGKHHGKREFVGRLAGNELPLSLSLDDVEATDWEVVDSK
jgi:hypothetical protein